MQSYRGFERAGGRYGGLRGGAPGGGSRGWPPEAVFINSTSVKKS
jgi:hypothetical protein